VWKKFAGRNLPSSETKTLEATAFLLLTILSLNTSSAGKLYRLLTFVIISTRFRNREEKTTNSSPF